MEYLLGSKTTFTTGEIAKILDVNINTVVKWFETGLLEGYKLPGSHARRIPRSELIEFLTKRNFPVTPAPNDPVVVLLLSSQSKLVEQFRAAAEDAFGYELYCASDAFEAGLVCARRVPDIIFIHLGHTDFSTEEFRRCLESRSCLARAELIALTEKDMDESALAGKGFSYRLSLPTSSESILDTIDGTVAKNRSRSVNFPPIGH